MDNTIITLLDVLSGVVPVNQVPRNTSSGQEIHTIFWKAIFQYQEI